jgi:hypothetical protein
METCHIKQYTYEQIQTIGSTFDAVLDDDFIQILLEIKKNNKFYKRRSGNPLRMKYIVGDSWRVSGKETEEITDEIKFTQTIQANLNRLSKANIDCISSSLIELFLNLPEQNPNEFLDQVFEKTLEENLYSGVYASLIYKILQTYNEISLNYLINKCDNYYNNKVVTVVEELKKDSNANYDEICKVFSTKAEFIGIFIFISNLFNCDLVKIDSVNKYFNGLKEYINGNSIDNAGIYIDCICSILKSCGKKLEIIDKENFVQNYMSFIDELIANKKKFPAKYRFKLMDIKALHKNNWSKQETGWLKA